MLDTIFENAKKQVQSESTGCIWPKQFAELTPETAWEFVRLCRTWNESEKEIQAFPDKEYLRVLCREWVECRNANKTMVIEKSRRMVVSWALRCLELWDMGQTQGKMILTHLTHDAASSHVWRMYFMYEDLRKRFPEWRLQEPRPWGSPVSQSVDKLTLPNQSLIEHYFEKPIGLQGAGYSLVSLEELAIYGSPAAMVDQANTLVEGSAGVSSGFVCAVTNVALNDAYEKVIEGYAPWGSWNDKCENLMTGFVKQVLPKCVFYQLHYTADEDKRGSWGAEKRAQAKDTRVWDTQYEMRRIVIDGVPVFNRYDDERHCPKSGEHKLWRILEGSLLWGGWDAGQTLSPAFVLDELTENLRVRSLIEVVSYSGESMEEFAPRVLKVLTDYFKLLGKDEEEVKKMLASIRHRGDATIVQRAGSDKTTARDVAKRYDIDIKPLTNNWEKRRTGVEHILALEPIEESGVERYAINAYGCPTLRRGFQGLYKYELSARGQDSDEGRVLLTPLKNAYSHVHDAHQQACQEIYDMLKPKQGTGMTVTKRLHKTS